MFDRPVLYAKSTDGLIFKENEVICNDDFLPFHWNAYPFFFERVQNVLIEQNRFEWEFDSEKDIRVELSEEGSVIFVP